MLNDLLETLPDTSNPVVSILSGGLDSTILTYLLKKKYSNVIALSINYNQKHNIELKKAKKTTTKLNIPHHILDLNFLGDMVKNVSSLINNSDLYVPHISDVLGDPQPSTYIPYRNMLFMTIALSFAESNNAQNIFIGLQAHDLYGYWDTTPEFIESLNNITKLNRINTITLNAPFINFSKSDEILIGNELNVPFEDTWSCYNGDEINGACGTCSTCAERIKNFMDLHLIDPIPYKIEIPWNSK